MNSPRKALFRKPHYAHIVQSSIGTCILIAVIAYISLVIERALLIPPIGATCYILFVLPDSAFAQPRNVLFGHFFSGITGLVFVHFWGNTWWAIAVSAGAAVAIMQLTHTNHPPATATNVLVTMQSKADWSLLFGPIIGGCLIATGIAVIYNKYILKRNYPHYWL